MPKLYEVWKARDNKSDFGRYQPNISPQGKISGVEVGEVAQKQAAFTLHRLQSVRGPLCEIRSDDAPNESPAIVFFGHLQLLFSWQELKIPVHYASEEADSTRLGTSGPAVRAIVKDICRDDKSSFATIVMLVIDLLPPGPAPHSNWIQDPTELNHLLERQWLGWNWRSCSFCCAASTMQLRQVAKKMKAMDTCSKWWCACDQHIFRFHVNSNPSAHFFKTALPCVSLSRANFHGLCLRLTVDMKGESHQSLLRANMGQLDQHWLLDS